MSKRLVYFNGDYVPEDEARISIFDSALMFGDMVFEMTRTFNRKPYRLRHHLERLYESIKYAEIDLDMTIDEMEEATFATIEKNREALGGYDFQIMHDVTRGVLGLYAELVREGETPIVTINVIPLIRHIGGIASKFDTGTHFAIPRQQSVPARYIDPKAKNRSRIFYKIAETQVNRMEEGAMALLTDERGFVTEGTGNNFFMVQGRAHPDAQAARHPARGFPRRLHGAGREARQPGDRGRHRALRRARRGRGLVHEHDHLHGADHPLRLPPRGGRQTGADLQTAARSLVAGGGGRHRRAGERVRGAGRDLEAVTG